MNSFITPAFCIFAVAYAVLIYTNYGMMAATWDEFLHWEDIVKEVENAIFYQLFFLSFLKPYLRKLTFKDLSLKSVLNMFIAVITC